MSEYIQNLINLSRTESKLKDAIILETLEDDLRLIERMGYRKIEEATAGIYKLILLRFRGVNMVLLTSHNNPVLTADNQTYKNPSFDIKQVVSAKNALKNIFLNWIEKYNVIHVGSFNREKILSYKSLIEKLNRFTVGEIERQEEATGSTGYDFSVTAL